MVKFGRGKLELKNQIRKTRVAKSEWKNFWTDSHLDLGGLLIIIYGITVCLPPVDHKIDYQIFLIRYQNTNTREEDGSTRTFYFGK